jgi:hypothetical protein
LTNTPVQPWGDFGRDHALGLGILHEHDSILKLPYKRTSGASSFLHEISLKAIVGTALPMWKHGVRNEPSCDYIRKHLIVTEMAYRHAPE